MRPAYILGALLVVGAIIAVLQFFPGEQSPTAPVQNELPAAVAPANSSGPAGRDAPMAAEDKPPEPGAAVVSEPVPIAPESPPAGLPALHDSDAFVLEQIEDWPVPQPWLNRDSLLARVAVVLQNAAAGAIPRRQVSFLTPSQNYPVVVEGERYFVDPAGYERYNTIVDVIEAIPPSELADLLERVDPLLVQALAELGERRLPRDLVSQSIRRLQALPRLPERIELLRPNVMYTYADAAIEALPELDKQALRMGPKNIARIQAYLSEFKEYYEVD